MKSLSSPSEEVAASGCAWVGDGYNKNDNLNSKKTRCEQYFCNRLISLVKLGWSI